MSSKKVKITAECVVNGNIIPIGTVIEVDETEYLVLLGNNRAVSVEEGA
jgi:hypothetical protein